jgi:hypothetical protein
VGRALGVSDGYLVNLTQTQVQTGFEIPQWSEGTQRWLTSYFCLRGSADVRDAICLSPQSGGAPPYGTGNAKTWLANSSIRYFGELQVVAIPKGSVWSLTLSDTPNVRAPPTALRRVPFGNSNPAGFTPPREARA